MVDLPTGTVTFLFTDIVGSTQLLHELGPGYDAVFTAHRKLLRAAFEAYHGHEVDTQGDAFFVAFQRASDALACAVAAQQALAAYPWPDGHPIEVRMGLHIGEPRIVEDHYVGVDVHRAARVAAAGHGGQIVLSQAVYGLAAGALPPGTSVRDLGRHRLKDLPQPEHLYDVLIEGLRQDFAALKTLEARPHNLPIPPTPLVGREKELTAIEGLVRRETVRLVTLIGPGGTGKTRLSLQVAMDVLEDFRDGVYFVDLSPITDAELVVATIAQALGVREQGSRPLLDLLKDYLREKQLLLLLDNFEQVIPAAKVVAELLGAARKLKVLVTSREVLHLRGEHDYAVPPLEVPHGRPLPPLERLTQYEAVRLFIERAQAVKADFEVTSENAPAVAEICYRLDGLPLAIELAAARIRLLTPEAMLKRLDSRLKLLTGGARDAHYRQQTLRGAIEWSYDLLNEEEQRLFRRLGVFVGGWTLEAAEAVAQDRLNVEGWTVDESQFNPAGARESFAIEHGGLDVLEGLGSLVDKSLVLQREGADGEVRFSMLETIREYAGERLVASGEAEALRHQHAAYFLPLAEEAAPALRGPNQMIWLDRLEREHDNMRAALAWARYRREVVLGLRLSGALASFWYRHSHLQEGAGWLHTFLSQDDEEGLPAAPVSGVLAQACAFSGAGELAYRRGQFGEAADFDRRAADIYHSAGERWGEAWCLNNLGLTNAFLGDRDGALAALETSESIFRDIGDPWGRGISLANLSFLALNRGDLDQAVTLAEESETLMRTTGDKHLLASTTDILGDAHRANGDYIRARAHYQEALALGETLGDEAHLAEVFYNLGQVGLGLREAAEAAVCFERSLILARQTGSTYVVALAVDGIACVAEILGRPVVAARLFGAAQASLDTLASSLQAVERILHDKAESAVHVVLGRAAFAAEIAAGRALTLDEAEALALEITAEAAA